MMEKDDDIPIAPAIELLELTRHPRELAPVRGDVRIERYEERVAVAERKRGIPFQPPRRIFRRVQIRVRGQRVAQSRLAIDVADGHGRRVVVAYREEVPEARARQLLHDGNVRVMPTL